MHAVVVQVNGSDVRDLVANKACKPLADNGTMGLVYWDKHSDRKGACGAPVEEVEVASPGQFRRLLQQAAQLRPRRATACAPAPV